MQKRYLVKLDGEIISFTYFESHDAPMGMVFGKIYFEKMLSGYEFFTNYCNKFGIPVNENDPEFKYIETQTFDNLTVTSENGTAIKGIGAAITGCQDEIMVEIFGVPYPFYGEEFPHHVVAYDRGV